MKDSVIQIIATGILIAVGIDIRPLLSSALTAAADLKLRKHAFKYDLQHEAILAVIHLGVLHPEHSEQTCFPALRPYHCLVSPLPFVIFCISSAYSAS